MNSEEWGEVYRPINELYETMVGILMGSDIVEVGRVGWEPAERRDKLASAAPQMLKLLREAGDFIRAVTKQEDALELLGKINNIIGGMTND